MFFKSFESFCLFKTLKKFANTELDKTEMQMNLQNRTLSTEKDYYQENMEYLRKNNTKTIKKKPRHISGIPKGSYYNYIGKICLYYLIKHA